jgi:aspartokinase
MPTIVLKFGGTSLSSLRRVHAAAARVARSVSAGDRVAVVVSAMGSTTDRLLGLARQAHPDPPGRELDALLATGELLSASLLSMALARLGLDATSLNAIQAGIESDAMPGQARIERIDAAAILRHLDAGRIPVIAGFQGVDAFGDLTTLGRGGSDTTAVAVAAAIGAAGAAGWCEILTDVPGVCTADPRLLREAIRIPSISAETMLELARRGAKVMHPPAVAIAAEAGVRIRVAAAHRGGDGTWILQEPAPQSPIASPIAVAIRSHLTELRVRVPIGQCNAVIRGDLSRACPSLIELGTGTAAGESAASGGDRRVLVAASEEPAARAALRECLAAEGGEIEVRGHCSLVSQVCDQPAESSPAESLGERALDGCEILASGGAGTRSPWVLVPSSQAILAAKALHRPIRERWLRQRRQSRIRRVAIAADG